MQLTVDLEVHPVGDGGLLHEGVRGAADQPLPDVLEAGAEGEDAHGRVPVARVLKSGNESC